VNLIANAFYQVLFQRFAEKKHDNRSLRKEALMFLRRMALVMAIPFILSGIFFPAIFVFVFGDQWIEAGKYAQILLPWIFMVSLVMPLSFIPDLYRKQRVAMIIDFLKLLGRGAGLAIGVVFENLYLGLALYSGFSALVIGYSLFWYLKLVKMNPPADEPAIPLEKHE